MLRLSHPKTKLLFLNSNQTYSKSIDAKCYSTIERIPVAKTNSFHKITDGKLLLSESSMTGKSGLLFLYSSYIKLAAITKRVMSSLSKL